MKKINVSKEFLLKKFIPILVSAGIIGYVGADVYKNHFMKKSALKPIAKKVAKSVTDKAQQKVIHKTVDLQNGVSKVVVYDLPSLQEVVMLAAAFKQTPEAKELEVYTKTVRSRRSFNEIKRQAEVETDYQTKMLELEEVKNKLAAMQSNSAGSVMGSEFSETLSENNDNKPSVTGVFRSGKHVMADMVIDSINYVNKRVGDRVGLHTVTSIEVKTGCVELDSLKQYCK